MMVVLLIVAIVAAATAPMVTKKMARNAGSNDSPWVFTGLGGNIAYNMNGNDNTTVLIGTTSVPNGWAGRARLFVDSGNNAAHIAFGNGNTTPMLLTVDPNASRVGFSNAEIPANSVAFGTGQSFTGSGHVAIGRNLEFRNNGTDSILIGQNGLTSASRTIVIGSSSSTNRPYATQNDAIAIGGGSEATGISAIAIGSQSELRTTAGGTRAIAIGTHISDGNIYGLTQTRATAVDSIAIGTNASSTGTQGVAIGRFAQATGVRSLAIGPGYREGTLSASTRATAQQSMALGFNAQANHTNSVAIGPGATTSGDRQIVLGAANTREIILGDENTIVTIPGFLRVGKNTVLGYRGTGYRTFISNKTYGRGNWHLSSIEVNKGSNDDYRMGEDYSESAFKSAYSDRRLKNVGEKYTAGLDELKKLEFFHYTFKKDENKTPMVGVMAQDLQKVFPDAVTKGDDGYLRIRLEDMFYAVINAVKELDSKISQIVSDITNVKTTIQTQQETIESLKKENSELKAEIKNFEKRIEKLEK